jgi:dihydroorotate dehydrogenase electron transfer subunit
MTSNTIFLEEAVVISHREFAGDQHILRVRAPKCAARAEPGSFVHLTCGQTIAMRRPLSIMRVNRKKGWLEFLYKPVGAGLTSLKQRIKGEMLSVLGPIGNGFKPDPSRPCILAIGGGVGIPPMIFLAENLQNDDRFEVLVLMGSEVPFPFDLGKAAISISGMPSSATHSVKLLEEWGTPSRAASKAGYEGCFHGFVPELAGIWLQNLSAKERKKTQLMGCGPTAMLKATAALAKDFDLPCQLALEEFMACGVGGCAGCTVLLNTPEGAAMKRVCVDGPVFDAYQLY